MHNPSVMHRLSDTALDDLELELDTELTVEPLVAPQSKSLAKSLVKEELPEEEDRFPELENLPGEDSTITLDILRRVMPSNRKNLVTESLVNEINKLMQDPELQRGFRENVLGYVRVLKDPRYRLTDYLNAVRYVSHKLLGDSNITAYSKTFPLRYKKLLDSNTAEKDIHSHISAYNRNSLVQGVLEQTLVPHYVLNQDLYQKALNVQAQLMLTARSEKVRSDAANSLLSHLKMPEVAKVELDVKVKEDDSIAELRRSTMELVKQQRAMIESGAMKAAEVGAQKLVLDMGMVDEVKE